MKTTLLLLLGTASAAWAQAPAATPPLPAPELATTASPFYVAAYASGFWHGAIARPLFEAAVPMRFFALGASVGIRHGKRAYELAYSASLPTQMSRVLSQDAFNTYTADSRNTVQAYTLRSRDALPVFGQSARWGAEFYASLTLLTSRQEVRTYRESTAGRALTGVEQTAPQDFQIGLGLCAHYQLATHWQLTGELEGRASLAGYVTGAILNRWSRALGGGLTIGTRYNF